MMPTHIILHNSATKDSGTVSWQAIRRYHMSYAYNGEILNEAEANHLISEGKNVKHPWSDIGYHFGIEQIKDRPEILVGRMMNRPGAHCRQELMNFKSVGICIVGDFDIYPPSKETWELALALVSSLCELLKVEVKHVQGHNEYAPYKTCPGIHWNMNKFRQELNSHWV